MRTRSCRFTTFGAGGLSNALPELAHSAGRGAWIELRAAPNEEPGMTPREVWCNEAQERYVLAVARDRLDEFRAICERERCPFAVVGTATADGHLTVTDAHFGNKPVDVDLSVILGKPPKMLRDVRRVPRPGAPLDLAAVELKEACYRVLRAPTVANKTFLISIGDRTVGGLCSRDQMVGPWQVPVADCAATLLDYRGHAGEAFAIGERTPLAVIEAAASGRMAVGEAITNIVAAPIGDLALVKLSANWMAAAGYPGEDAALYDTVHTVAMALCPQLGLAIPVGKDSLSMRTTWQENGKTKEVVAPLSLIVSAFAPCKDATRVLTPQLRTDLGATELILIDLGRGRNRLGASQLAQVYGQVGDRVPDLDEPASVKTFFTAIQALNGEGLLLAYHDRSDGGLFATVCEMAFAGRCGVTLNLDLLAFDALAHDVEGNERRPELMQGRDLELALGALFAEELGAVVQVRADDRVRIMQRLADAGLHALAIGAPNARDEMRIVRNAKPVLAERRVDLQRTWSELSYRMQALRDNPDCARRRKIRSPARRERPGAIRSAGVRYTRRCRCALHRHWQTSADRDSARAGRQWSDRDGRGLRPRRLRGDRCAHERHPRRACAPRRVPRLRGMRRFFVRRRARRGRRLGEIDTVQCTRARRVRALLRTERYICARHLQWLPDDGGLARVDSRRRRVAALPAQPFGAIRGAVRDG